MRQSEYLHETDCIVQKSEENPLNLDYLICLFTICSHKMLKMAKNDQKPRKVIREYNPIKSHG